MRILVVGASGYIGGRLVPLLQSRGHDLVLMSRDARPLAARFPEARVVAADLLDPSTLPPALEGIEAAYWYLLYPVHGLIFRGTVRVLAERAIHPAGPGRANDAETSPVRG